jgi:hypothetical protein
MRDPASPHYNTLDEVEAFIESIDEIIRSPSNNACGWRLSVPAEFLRRQQQMIYRLIACRQGDLG